MARRGRPRLNRPAIDLGTPEQIRKRAEALGPQRHGWPAPNLNDSGTALGRLLWRGFLGDVYDRAKALFDAGEAFGTKWMVVYPNTNPIGTLGRFVPPDPSLKPITEEDRVLARRELNAMTRALGKDRAVLDAVINCCVYQRLNPRQIEKLKAGLCRLVERNRDQRRAA